MEHEYSRKEQCIALAALLQACYLVDRLSKTGQLESEEFFPLLNSLFEFNPENTRAVYGNLANVKTGLHILQELLEGKSKGTYNETLRYAIAVLHLEKKLYRNDDMMNMVRSRLEHASFRSTHFATNIDDMASSIAAVYQDTLSSFKFRIQISGQAQHLQNQLIADKIRALLFAGVRAAILWQQLGGNRWKLLLYRKRYNKLTGELLSEH
jgi:high frequency lysogenization protein